MGGVKKVKKVTKTTTKKGDGGETMVETVTRVTSETSSSGRDGHHGQDTVNMDNFVNGRWVVGGLSSCLFTATRSAIAIAPLFTFRYDV